MPTLGTAIGGTGYMWWLPRAPAPAPPPPPTGVVTFGRPLTPSTLDSADYRGNGCGGCGASANPSSVAGSGNVTPVRPPLGGGMPLSFSAANVKTSTTGATMCAGTDMKTDWWKFAIAAAVGYFFAKR